jgi:hypothetical protein
MTGVRTLAFIGAVAILALPGCSNTATVRYQHHYSSGAGWDKNGQLVEAGTGKFFAMYHVVCIRNKEKGAKNFTFTPGKLSTKFDGTIDNPLNDQFGLTGPIQVNAGQEKQNLGTVILLTKGAWAGNQIEFLTYNSAQGESVLLANDQFGPLGGPTLSTNTLMSGPAYPSGADMCDDPPIQAPH